MAKGRKGPSISTLRTNVSHLRKQLERVNAMRKVAPPASFDFSSVTVEQFGSQLKINGKIYSPKDLEALKGQARDWQLPAIAELERKLAEAEYKLIQATQREGKKVRKITMLTKEEKSQAEEGLDFVTSEEEMNFRNWLEENSGGYKKNTFYHEFGADAVNRASIRDFLQYMSMEMDAEIKTVDDLREVWP